MINLLVYVMSFAHFAFYPLVISTIIAVIIEQILRQVGNAYDPVAVKKVDVAMRVRKYFYRQAWNFNLIWFGAYFILMIFVKPGQSAMPDMIWDGI
tara:strand:- start:199 stop:486 length:288 start_codon:yes stop_codon:yes gene_type:complete